MQAAWGMFQPGEGVSWALLFWLPLFCDSEMDKDGVGLTSWAGWAPISVGLWSGCSQRPI